MDLSSFLYFQSRRAWLKVELRSLNTWAYAPLYTCIIDKDNTVCGLLPEKLHENIDILGKVCEFIAIPEGSSDSSLCPPNDKLSSKKRRDGGCQFYNLLLVEWVNGVAYRKALGWVDKSTWEETTTELLDITLG